MQLKHLANISAALAAASCAVLGQQAQAGTLLDDWQFNSAILLYNETDRVSAAEAMITARGDFGDDKFLNLGLVVDALTGASATGGRTARGAHADISRPHSGAATAATPARR